MKKVAGMMLACILLIFPLSGCQNSGESPTFETLSVTFDGGKTLSMEMNQEAVRKVVGEEPTETKEEFGQISDDWDLDYSFYVNYKTEEPYEVTKISLSFADIDFETSLGIAKGDSVASIKEKLGDLCTKSDSDESTSYSYAFRYADGKYEIVDPNKTIGELTGGSKDIGLYSATFICENDKVTGCYFSDHLA